MRTATACVQNESSSAKGSGHDQRIWFYGSKSSFATPNIRVADCCIDRRRRRRSGFVSLICPLSIWKPDVTGWDGLGSFRSKRPSRVFDPALKMTGRDSLAWGRSDWHSRGQGFKSPQLQD